jgi:hypothetical protein
VFSPEQKLNRAAFRTKNNSVSNVGMVKTAEKIQQLEEEDIKYSNRLELIIKEEKELKKERMALAEKISTIKVVREKLADQVYGGKINLREAQAQEVDQLKIYNQK